MEHERAGMILELHQRLMTLKLLPRTGWLQRGMQDVESIAEHTFGVATLALTIGDLHPELDRGKLLAIALLHDIAEALIGDLPASARRLFGSAAKRAAEQRAIAEMFAGLPQADEYLTLFNDYAEGGSPEARLVKALDRLELLLQALAYERAGSRAMAEFWEGGEADWNDEFPLVQTLAQQLIAARRSLNGYHHSLPPDHHRY